MLGFAVLMAIIFLYAQIRFDAYKIIDYTPKLRHKFTIETVNWLPICLMKKIDFM